MRITIFTDGSCPQNPGGPGGWCAVIAMHEDVDDAGIALYAEVTHAMRDADAKLKYDDPSGGKIAALRVLCGDLEETTNNRAEMTAIIEAFRSFSRPAAVCVVTDSKYAMNALSGRWKAKANLDLIEEWRRVSKGFVVSWRHVNGHSGHPINEFCDRVAGSMVKRREENVV